MERKAIFTKKKKNEWQKSDAINWIRRALQIMAWKKKANRNEIYVMRYAEK